MAGVDEYLAGDLIKKIDELIDKKLSARNRWAYGEVVSITEGSDSAVNELKVELDGGTELCTAYAAEHCVPHVGDIVLTVPINDRSGDRLALAVVKSAYVPGQLIKITKDDISSLASNPTHSAASWNDIGAAGDYLKTVSYTPPVSCYALAFLNTNVQNTTANQRTAVAILQNTSPIIARQDLYSYNANQWVPVACIGRAQCNAGVAQQFSGRIYVWGGTASVYKAYPATQLIVWFWKSS